MRVRVYAGVGVGVWVWVFMGVWFALPAHALLTRDNVFCFVLLLLFFLVCMVCESSIAQM